MQERIEWAHRLAASDLRLGQLERELERKDAAMSGLQESLQHSTVTSQAPSPPDMRMRSPTRPPAQPAVEALHAQVGPCRPLLPRG